MEYKMNLSICSVENSEYNEFQVIDCDNYSNQLYVGSYTQCLIYCGSRSLGKLHEDSVNFAENL